MSRRILIADDDLLFSKLLQYTLEQAGIDWLVETVTTGRQALEAMDRGTPDLMLLDLKMPDGDGFSVLQERRAKQQSFPVLVVTHMVAPEHEKQCQELGATSFIRKTQMRMPDLVVTMQRTLSVA